MKHLKTYEGLLDFLKKKNYISSKPVTDDVYDDVKDMLLELEDEGFTVEKEKTDGKSKVYITIIRNTQEYSVDLIVDVLSRIVEYARSFENSVRVSFHTHDLSTAVSDKPFNYISYIDVNYTTNKIVATDLHEKRVKHEKRKIEELLTSLEVHYSSIEWDGFNLNVFYTTKNGGHKTKCDRNDIVEYLPELDFKDLDTLEDYEAYIESELLY